MATSNDVMRPVILSRPENTAGALMIFCGGGAVTSSSPGCGAVLAGCGVPRGRWPGAGGIAAGSAGTPRGGGQDCGGVGTPPRAAGPGGGGKDCDGIAPTLGAAGARGGSTTRCWSTGGGGIWERPGTLLGGRGGAERPPNWRAARATPPAH